MATSKPDNRKIFQGASHRYVVLKPLGTGGMGSTWVVFDHKMGDLKTFTIKIMSPELARSERAREHFVHEARATAALEHPNIVNVMWIDELRDGTPLYAMELLNGESVAAALKRGPIPPQEALNIVIDVLDGLHFAHKHALVHQDIKPSNVVLHRNARGESVAKIIDFGVVRTADDRDRGFAGTFAYAAPEQIRGGNIGPATDIFGAGALLFEMLCASRPFAAYASNLAGAVARLDKRPPSILEFGRFPPELVAIVASALSPDIGERPATAKAFGLELRKIARELDAPRPQPQHISHVGRPILRGALADTTDQAGIEYAEIIARARDGAAPPLSVGASDTLEAPFLPVETATTPQPVLNDSSAGRMPDRPMRLATEPVEASVNVPPGISQIVTAPPSGVAAAASNVRPIYVDDSMNAIGREAPGPVRQAGGPVVSPMPVLNVVPVTPVPNVRAPAAIAPRLAAGYGGPASRVAVGGRPPAPFLPMQRPVVPSRPPAERTDSAIRSKTSPTKGRTVPMHPGRAIAPAGRPTTKPRYSPLYIKLRRLYQSRVARSAVRWLALLLACAAMSCVTYRYIKGVWPWESRASRGSTVGVAR